MSGSCDSNRLRFNASFIAALALGTTLSGCASCVNLQILEPKVEDLSVFEVSYNSAEAFLKSDAVSIWLRPCVDSRRLNEGTVCAVLFVTGPHTLRFASDKATVIRTGAENLQRVTLSSDEFSFSQELKGGEGGAASSNPLAWAAHRQQGTKWRFTIAGAIDFSKFIVGLPSLIVDGKTVDVPPIAFTPVVSEQCFTFH